MDRPRERLARFIFLRSLENISKSLESRDSRVPKVENIGVHNSLGPTYPTYPFAPTSPSDAALAVLSSMLKDVIQNVQKLSTLFKKQRPETWSLKKLWSKLISCYQANETPISRSGTSVRSFFRSPSQASWHQPKRR